MEGGNYRCGMGAEGMIHSTDERLCLIACNISFFKASCCLRRRTCIERPATEHHWSDLPTACGTVHRNQFRTKVGKLQKSVWPRSFSKGLMLQTMRKFHGPKRHVSPSVDMHSHFSPFVICHCTLFIPIYAFALKTHGRRTMRRI